MLEIVELEVTALVPARHHRQDAAGGARPKKIEQRRGEEERRQVVHGEGELEAVVRRPALADVHAGVVEEHVESVEPTLHLCGHTAHRFGRGQVSDDDLDR